MSPTPSPGTGAAHLRVFVIENHDDTRRTLSQLLSMLGHDVRCAASMQEALAALPAAEPDVVLSDIGLPDGDGWELMARAHLPGSVYAIAMSGYGMSADKERSAAAGFRHHLVKPMDLTKLEALLDEAARESCDRRAARDHS
ncbi:response regulator [Mitsuaria sp. GD03876]|uniref:response regulator n=1 Tax=Mitsuaria sp. GD03876 TaxID=2975399 RepID=UPI0024492B94|nr:response regulator [Mitsuaria sp. GD03876]MDH0865860.1 response regulator [Mitsuaria sp. GD03876]